MQIINTSPNLLELEFYSQVIDRMLAAVPGNYDVMIVSDPPDKPFAPLPKTGRKKVVFSFSDEKNRLPDYAADEDVIVVFKQYAPFIPHPKLCPIPMPHAAGFKPVSTPFFKRSNNFFFCGHANGSSRQELKSFAETAVFPDSVIQFTDKFGDGNKENYAKMLGSSKFAICPTGNNPETFRHVEAAMSGCIVISNHQGAHWYNAEVPFIYVNDWVELGILFDSLISAPEVCAKLSKDTLDYYNKFLSVEAVSKVCINVLKFELGRTHDYYCPQITLNL